MEGSHDFKDELGNPKVNGKKNPLRRGLPLNDFD
jgi:hypothetical protein